MVRADLKKTSFQLEKTPTRKKEIISLIVHIYDRNYAKLRMLIWPMLWRRTKYFVLNVAFFKE